MTFTHKFQGSKGEIVNIVKGQQIWIKPEWQDDGDDELTWFAVENSADDRGEMPRIRIACVESLHLPIPPVESVSRSMITTQPPLEKNTSSNDDRG